MQRILNRLLNISLIIIILFLILNEYYVIEFSSKLKDVFIFLSLILILITAIREILTSSSKLSKFVNGVILISTVIGGVGAIATGQLNLFIYICIMFSLIYCFIDLVYKKA